MQFLVPQFIDVEPKLFGPVSVRQFVIMAVSAALSYAAWSAFIIWAAIPIILIILAIGFAFAFVKINTQPLHLYLMHFVRTFRKPRLKVWKKMLTPPPTKKPPKDKVEEETQVTGPPPKKAAEIQNLGELALILDTGGTYRGSEQRDLVLPKQTAAAPKKSTKKQPKNAKSN